MDYAANIGEALAIIDETALKKGRSGLERMERILSLLGNPERDLKIIHIGGTNGKGSVCAFVSSVLRNAGYKVAVYTSPHVMDFNERFECCGRYITEDEFTGYANEVFKSANQAAEEGMGYPSPFEVITAAAYLFFRDMNPDFAIIEVGLGGRIDSTNTVEKPLITAITEIGLDHTEQLGDTIEKIAREKAGIIKKGIPVVCGVTAAAAVEVIRKIAESEKAEFTNALPLADNIPELLMRGLHQRRNAAVAKAIILDLRSRGIVQIDNIRLDEGLAKTLKIGRYEVLSKDPTIILDAAHNPSGLMTAIDTFNKDKLTSDKSKRILILLGIMVDKDYVSMAKMIAEAFVNRDAFCITTEPESDRALKATKLRDILEESGLNSIAVSDNTSAFKKSEEIKYDIMLCIGSIYLIGKFRSYYINHH